MNLGQRGLLALNSLILLALAVGVIVITWGPDLAIDADGLHIGGFITANDQKAWIVTGVAALVGLFAVLCIAAAFHSAADDDDQQREPRSLQLKGNRGQELEVTDVTLESLVVESIEQEELAGVREVVVREVKKVRNGLQPEIEMVVETGADIPGALAAVRDATVSPLAALGVDVREPNIAVLNERPSDTGDAAVAHPRRPRARRRTTRAAADEAPAQESAPARRRSSK